MFSTQSPKIRIERFTHPVPVKSFLDEDEIYSFDIGKDIMFSYDLLESSIQGIVQEDNLQENFKKAQKELQEIEGVIGKTAWDDLVSFIDEFREKELEIRKNLRKKYYGTEMWDIIKFGLEQIDVDTKAVLRSAIRLYTMDHVYSYINKCF